MEKVELYFNKNGLSYKYYIPSDRKKGEKLPLIVFLHGAGERADDIKGFKNEYFFDHFLPKKLRAMVIAPHCKTGLTWKMQIEKVKELIETFAKENDADMNRITMTGLSMGAFGTYDFAMTYPDMLAGIACICGGGDEWRAELIKDMPIRMFHGDLDDTVPVSRSLDLAKKLENVGGHPELVIYHGVGHNSWDLAYSHTNVIEWLFGLEKNKK